MDRRIKLSAVVVALAAGPVPVLSAAELTRAEEALVQKCEDNIKPELGSFSPAAAAECIAKFNEDDNSLLNRLNNISAMRAGRIMNYSNALVDLDKMISGRHGAALAVSLSRVLEQSYCSLCDMGLGARPEKLFGWVDKYRPEDSPRIKKAARTWDYLGGAKTEAMAAKGFNKENWNELPLGRRRDILSEWAEKEALDLLNIPPEASDGAGKLVPALLEELEKRRDLAGRLSDLLLKIKAGSTEQAKEPGAGTDTPEKFGKADEIASLKDRKTEEKSAFLNGLFDKAANSPAESGTQPGAVGPENGPAVSVDLSPEQFSVLSAKILPAIKDEIKGTKAGDELLAFYADPGYSVKGINKPNIVFERMKWSDASSILAEWDPEKGDIRINTELVNEWIAKNKVTPEGLLSGKAGASNPHLKALAAYLAPTFVHEATHQRQDAWAVSEDIVFSKYSKNAPYQIEAEVESFAAEASYAMEKLMRNGPDYMKNMIWSAQDAAETFAREGVDGLRQEKHTAYYSFLHSIEGQAAWEFEIAQSMSSTQWIKEEMTATRMKWYKLVTKRTAENERKFNAWREELLTTLLSQPELDDTRQPPEL